MFLVAFGEGGIKVRGRAVPCLLPCFAGLVPRFALLCPCPAFCSRVPTRPNPTPAQALPLSPPEFHQSALLASVALYDAQWSRPVLMRRTLAYLPTCQCLPARALFMQPCVTPFGADQFDETDPRQARFIPKFFSYCYAAM